MYLMIEPSSNPIQGSVSVGGGRARVFSGWIELAGVIEEARLGAGYLRAGMDSPGEGGGGKSGVDPWGEEATRPLGCRSPLE